MNRSLRTPLAFLVVLIATRQLPGESRWPDERRIGWLVVHADFSLQSLVPLLNQTVDLRKDVSATLRLQHQSTPIHLYLFRRKTTFEKYIRKYYPDVPPRRALFVKERGHSMVFAYQSSELAVDLRHEMTHAILNSALPVVPLWLDEGIAEYFEVMPARRLAGNKHLRSLDAQSRIASIEQLENVDGIAGMTKKDYRDAWAWAHWMLSGSPEARNELLAFIGGLQAHQVQQPLSHRIRKIFPNANNRVHQHILYTKLAARRAAVQR